MRAGIFGGTFDPVHNGHLITVRAVGELLGLDKIIFVPCYISPHKTTLKSSSAEDRLSMLKLAIEGQDFFGMSSVELERGGISYMIDTLQDMKQYYQQLDLIIGYDNLEKFYTWKEPDRILQTARLIVMKRVTDQRELKRDKYFESARFVDTPNIEISSTQIRQRVKDGLSVDYMVPEKVAGYIKEKGLYK